MRFALASLALLLALPAFAQTRPATYAEFTTTAAGDGNALKAALTATPGAATYLYVRPGIYTLPNPVPIARTTSLFVHCGDRNLTQLVAADPTRPLFTVSAATLINFTGCKFSPSLAASNTTDAKAITFTNAAPVAVEFQDCNVERAGLVLSGPGSYRIQNCVFTPLGRVASPLVVDHDAADVFMIGGGVTNSSGFTLAGGITEYFHAWQKRGRLRIYSITTGNALGYADFRFDRRAAAGPHVVASVRSEGYGHHASGTYSPQVSRLVYVPPTPERVELVVKNSDTSTLRVGPSLSVQCKIASYSGAGTLWVLGNITHRCGQFIAEGTASAGARVISIGNMIAAGPATGFAITGADVVSVADLWQRFYYTGDATAPAIRWLDDTRPLTSLDSIPQPPPEVIPPALTRPQMTAALPGMIDVKLHYGAAGDGVNDDTAEIQAALDANCNRDKAKLVYFPAGTYKISDTLRHNYHLGACHDLGYGGWIAGAGSAATRIVMADGMKKGTFLSDGMGHATIQGITFDTWTWQTGDPREPNVDIEKHGAVAVVPTSNGFYDIATDGGYAGLAVGVRYTSANGSEMLLVGSRFQNAHIGWANGHQNTIGNTAYDSEFVGNAIAISGDWVIDALGAGGHYNAVNSRSRGTRIRDFTFAAAGTYGFYGWDSDAPAFVAIPSNANPFAYWLEGSHFAPASPVAYPFDSSGASGFTFLRSQLTRGSVRAGEGSANGYVVDLGSDLPSPTLGANGRSAVADWGAAAIPSPPAAPVLLQ